MKILKIVILLISMALILVDFLDIVPNKYFPVIGYFGLTAVNLSLLMGKGNKKDQHT